MIKEFVKDLFAGDIKKVKNYVVNDVLKPRTKQIMWELGSGSLRTFIFDDGDPVQGGKGKGPYWQGPNSKTQTGGYSPLAREYVPDRNKQNMAKPNAPAEKPVVSVKNYMYVSHPNRAKAEYVRDELIRRLETYRNTPGHVPMVTIKDLAQLAELEFETPCCNWGWDDLSEITIMSSVDEEEGTMKYRIKLPPARSKNEII